jgi:hypothetical protein
MARRHWYRAGTLGLTALLFACSSTKKEPSVSKQKGAETIEVGPIPKDNPKLGAIADVAPVFDQPRKGAERIGYLHAGAKVARAKEPYDNDDCVKGWYPIRPRGFVCTGQAADTDMTHPTLSAMALEPKLDEPLPYTYARTTKETPLFEQDKKQDRAVKKVGKMRSNAGLAVVGSWKAKDDQGELQRLGLLPNGLFARAADLEAAKPSGFRGIEVSKEQQLPAAFVVKRGVNFFDLDKGIAKKTDGIDYHQRIDLSGRFRTVDDDRYWASADGRWVRHRDVTVVRRRHTFPDFAKGQQKWIDVSIVTGTMVLYEGQRPVYATLVSVGRDRLGDPKTTASTEMGTFDVVAKHITHRDYDPKKSSSSHEVYDLPWVLELSSGQMLHAAYWHDRFGIEHTDGMLHVSPADGGHIFAWATPALPEGWHSVRGVLEDKTLVIIRK